MKKNNILYACAAAALVFASCQKEAPAPVAPETADMNVISARTLATKTTTQDGVNMLWENGDQIRLYTRTWNEAANKYDAGWCDYTTTLDAPNSTATFVRDEANTNTVDNTSGRYFAVYRKGAPSYIHQSRDYYMMIALDKEVVVKNGGDFSASIMCATSRDAQFYFSHVVSYIKFTVDQNTTPFKELVVSPVNDSELVTSRIKITFATDELIQEVLSGNSQDSKTITLTTDDKQNFAAGTYYFAVNPGTYSEGLKFTFVNEDGQIVNMTTPVNVQMKAGDVANLGTVGRLDFPTPEVPETPTTLELGKAYANDGVVFWINPDNDKQGKVFSAAVKKIRWGTSSATTYDWIADINTDNGILNQEYVLGLNVSNAETYPAVYYCKNLGEGWRLPTINEMNQLNDVYQAGKEAFNAEIAGCLPKDSSDGLIELASSTWYWTGQAYIKDGDSNTNKVGRVKIANPIYISGSNAKNECYVRCVRDVEIK